MNLDIYNNIILTEYYSEAYNVMRASRLKIEKADLVLIITDEPNIFHINKNRYGETGCNIHLKDKQVAKLLLLR